MIIISCHKDSIEETIIIDDFEPITIYEVDVKGIIADQDGAPIENALVSITDKTIRTDQYGYFKLEDISSGTQGSWLDVTAAGYIATGRRIDVLNSLDIIVTVNMLDIPDEASFNGADGGRINISDEASVTFFPNGITRDGQAYGGNVFIRALSISPDDPDLIKRMPGNLVGVTLDNDIESLQSYGMFYITLEDDMGNELQPSVDTKAILRMKIPEAVKSDAPTSMPMWYFDQSLGFWKEEGIAEKIGDFYEASVSHFTWWNIDLPVGDLVNVCITVKGENDILPNTDILYSSPSQQYGVLTSNAEGVICTALPRGEVIALSLFIEACDAGIDEAMIGPFSEDQKNIDVTLLTTSDSQIKISGTVRNCDNETINESRVYVIRSGKTTLLETSDQGEYAFTFYCSTNGEQIEIIAIDQQNEKSDNSIITLSNEDLIEKNITVCDDISDVIIGTAGDDAINGIVTDVQVNPNETILITDNQCYLSFLGNTTGTFKGALQCSNNQIYEGLDVTVTQFDSIIKGTFTGVNISGSFSTANN